MATLFITVPIEIMHDKNLNANQKFLLAEIQQLSTLKHGCIASNRHFSELIGIAKENISRNLKALSDMGYILIKTKPGSRNHERRITLINTPCRNIKPPLDETSIPPYQNVNPPLTKRQETKGNRVFNKTFNNSVKNKKPENTMISASDVLKELGWNK